MKLRRSFQLLAGVALLGAIATYIETTRTTAQSSERAVTTGEGAPARIAALPPPDAAIESTPSDGNVRTTARPDAASERARSDGNVRTAARPDAASESARSDANVRTAARPPEAASESARSDANERTTARTPETASESAPSDGKVRITARTSDVAVESSPSAGNPLWALALTQLSATRDRPIFSPSRRPPPPATPTYVAPVAMKQPVKPAEPERPAVTLLGTVIGEDDRIGVFLEAATGNQVRLRVGEDHQGWVLRLIKAREVTLVKDREQVAVLELPRPGESVAGGNPLMPGGLPAPLGGPPGMAGGVPGGVPARGAPPGGTWMPPGGIVGLPGGVPGAAGTTPGGVPGATTGAQPRGGVPGAQPGRRQSAR